VSYPNEEMSVSTAELVPVDVQALSVPEVGAMYMSYRQDLRLVKTPKYPIMGPDGRKVGEKPGETVQFVNNVLRVPPEGDAILEDGRAVPSGELVEWLESHRLFGQQYEGFWRVDPVAPPPSEDEIRLLTDAVLGLDSATLDAIIEREAAGYGREAILKPAREAVEKVREAQSQLETAAKEAVANAKAEASAEQAAEVKKAQEAAKAADARAKAAEAALKAAQKQA